MQNDITEHLLAIKDYIIKLLTTLGEMEQLPPPYNIWVSGAKTHTPYLNNTLRHLVKIGEDISYAEEFIKRFFDCQENQSPDRSMIKCCGEKHAE